jgi:hypothetical protein
MQHGVSELMLTYNTDLTQINCEDVDWIQVAQDMTQWRAFVNTAMNLQVPQN